MEDENELKNRYVNEFYNKDYYRAINWCANWNGTNGRVFGAKCPEDFIIEMLENILFKDWKCYLKSYEHFRNSVYYHLKNAMLNYFSTERAYKNILLGDEPDTTFENEIIDYGNETIFADLEANEITEQIKTQLEKEDRVEEFLVFELLLENYNRTDIANELNLSVDKVTNIKKRLQQVVRKIIKGTKTLEREK